MIHLSLKRKCQSYSSVVQTCRAPIQPPGDWCFGSVLSLKYHSENIVVTITATATTLLPSFLFNRCDIHK